jgi:hypothetical protein
VHWTYSERKPDSDLEQGDFLVPSDKLRGVLNNVHPHFCANKYLGFAVTTQSCDLVRRGEKPPRARYINIATVRSLQEVTPRLLESVSRPVARGIFRKSERGAARDFLHRLFNQNEQALGLFYLHPDADIGLGDPSVVFLRVVIALRAEHYDTLVEARKGGLAPEFQAKFGWLVGNLYSRAATPDWADQQGGNAELNQLIKSHLMEHIPGCGPIWVEDELITAGQEAGVVLQDCNPSEVVQKLEPYRPSPPIERLAKEVSEEAKKALTLHNSERDSLDEAFQKVKEQILKLCEDPSQPHAEGADYEHSQHGALTRDEIRDTVSRIMSELRR